MAAVGTGSGKRAVWPVLAMAGMLGLVAHPATSHASYEEHLSERLSEHLSERLSERLSRENAVASPAFATRGTDNVQDLTGGLVHRGKRGMEPVIESRGSDVALAHALPLLAPEGWSVSGAHRATETPVSWDAGTGWLATLERLARQTGTVLVVDWENACLVVGGKDDLQAAATATPKVLPVASGEVPAPASSLVVSHHGGYGLVYLARPMTAERAATVFDVRLADLLAWNGIASKSETLPEGRALWLRDPSLLGPNGPDGNAAANAAGSNATANAAANTVANAATVRGAPAKRLEGKRLEGREAGKAQAACGKTGSPAAKARETDSPDQAHVAQALAGARDEKRARDEGWPGERAWDTNAAATGASRNGPGNMSGPAPGHADPDNPATSAAHAARATWTLAPGSLHDQVESWAARAGWKLVWHADTDLAMEAAAGFAGSFPEAVRALFEGLHENGAPYRARLFHGNRVLQVEDR